MSETLKCPLADCGEKVKNGTGYAAHCRAHVLRGEANFAADGKTLIRVSEVPIVTEPYARKLRMDDIKSGKIKAQIHLPSKAQQKAKTAIVPAKRGRPPKDQVHIPSDNGDGNLPLDISKLNPAQIEQLRAQLFPQGIVEDHSCPTTRASDRLKQAVALTSFAEMMDDVSPDQLLLMMSQMRTLQPMMPISRRNGR